MARLKRLGTTPEPELAQLQSAEEPEDDFGDSDLPDLKDDFGGEAEEEMNNPDVTHLDAPPMLGGRSRHSELFGESAEYAAGRATSPKLYAQAAQFPTCTQLRVWKWENGIPVGLGTIDSTATEEEFVRQFLSAMPKKGEGRGQYKLRPIDIRGQELGQEVTTVISEHHAAIRAAREAEEEERNPYAFGGPDRFAAAPGGTDMNGEMSRMVEHMLATAESRAKQLEESLEMERERMRQEELARTRERVDLAQSAAQGVQVLTERMMRDEAARAERAMQLQQEQSQTLITTLTSIFAQQQSAAQQAAEAARRADEYRLEQERRAADRERQAAEERRKLELQDWEFRRVREREEAETRIRLEREESERRRADADRLLMQAKAEMELRIQREREESEAKRREAELKLQYEREESQRRFEAARAELELRLSREREEIAAKERREREEAERRERWFAEERARREARESQEAREREQERQRQHDRMVKELELQAQKDREHAERMVALSKAEQNASQGDVLTSAAKLFSQFGVPPDQIFRRLFGAGGDGGEGDEEGEEKGGGWGETFMKVLPVLGDVMKASMNGRPGPQQAPQAGPMPQLPPPGVPPEWQQAQMQQPRSRVPVTRPAPQQRPAQAAAAQRMAQTIDAATAAPPVREDAPVAEVAPVAEAPAPTEAPSAEVAIAEAAKSLPLRTQKAARVAIRKLVKEVSQAPDTDWEQIIGVAVMNEIAIYEYVNAVTVKAAMVEGGASEELTTRIIAAMRKSALVPENFNYGDEA
jgi:hypothetical protein